MSISVITTTISLGGLDMLINSMAAQVDAPQFEVIFVDEWFEQRMTFQLLELALRDQWKFTFRHVAPTDHHDYIDHCHGWNTGLRYAEGELICFLNDYIWAYPHYLRDHWQIYKSVSGYSAMGYLDRYPWPSMNESKEVKDVWWTSFKDEFTANRAEHYFKCVEPIYQERMGWQASERINGTDYFRMPGSLFYASLNHSIPLAVLKEINGWDERFDHSYGKNDIDLGMRAECVGWKFALLPTVNCKIGMDSMGRSAVHSIMKERMPKERNEQMLEEKWRAIHSGGESVRTPSLYGCW